MMLIPEERPLVILDTGIVCAAAFNPRGVAETLVTMMVDGEITVYISNRLRAEYERTLHQPALAARFPFLTDVYIAAFLDRFDIHAERIANSPTVFAYPRDVNDEPLINLAIATQADYLITLDNDLLALPKYPDFAALPRRPRVMKPGEFLVAVGKVPPPQFKDLR